MEEHSCCCCGGTEKTTMRTEEEKRKLQNRLKRIEGQVRGLQAMIERMPTAMISSPSLLPSMRL